MSIMAVTEFSDANAIIIQCLKAFFASDGEFSEARISIKKQSPEARDEIVVFAEGGSESFASTVSETTFTCMVFSEDFKRARKLAGRTRIFLKALPSLASGISWVEIINPGEEIANPYGSQVVFNITGAVTRRALKTHLF